jgi:penicillin-binding protein 1C
VGYDGRYTIAVWVGRPDATATAGLTGRGAAAPILFDAFARLSERLTPLAAAPSGVLRLAGAGLPPPLRRFRDSADEIAQGPYLEPAVQFAFPPDRAELESDEDETQPVMLKAEGGVLPLTWLADGKPIGSDPTRRELSWQPDGRGFVHVSVIDARGRTDRVQIRLR